MTIEKAIFEAIKNGYDAQWSWFDMGRGNPNFESNVEHVLLDPSFWQSLGKMKGYVGDAVANSVYYLDPAHKIPYWQYLWCTFIDHLAEGKDAESFFAEL